ncbi:MAG: hypothetical protein A2048_08795 [Deltaproteobacteria bacterium GWA2_45_12]|nr:MAG: hypothetical protein A2048_08795 [Deltaproteobacteria bacterium GWA2_45_12]
MHEVQAFHQEFPDVNAATLLAMATINGARALCMDNEIGSLEVGKKADIIGFKLNHLKESLEEILFERMNVDFSMIDGKRLII